MVAKETEPPQGSFLSVKAYSTDLETKQVMKLLSQTNILGTILAESPKKQT